MPRRGRTVQCVYQLRLKQIGVADDDISGKVWRDNLAMIFQENPEEIFGQWYFRKILTRYETRPLKNLKRAPGQRGIKVHLHVEQRTKVRSQFSNLDSSYLTRSVKPQKPSYTLSSKQFHHFYCMMQSTCRSLLMRIEKLQINKQPHTNADISQLSRVFAKIREKKKKYGKRRKSASACCAQDKGERLQFLTWPSLVSALTSLEHPVCPFQFPDGTTS